MTTPRPTVAQHAQSRPSLDPLSAEATDPAEQQVVIEGEAVAELSEADPEQTHLDGALPGAERRCAAAS